MERAGIYLSVPFCRQKCTYCNFASDVHPSSQLPRYLRTLQTEVARRSELWEQAGLPWLESVSADSIYLGGGTPGLLTGEPLSRLLEAVGSAFRLAPEPEVTLEASPENVTAEQAAAWVSCGINRVSLGVQSMVTGELRAVARMHDASIVGNAFAVLRDTGISNISVDLIAGLPHQTEESWQASLQGVLNLEPTHLSVYMLEVDEESRLGGELLRGGTRYAAGAAPTEEQVVAFYALAVERLRGAGYHHYEISNFALPGKESRHNEKYWTNVPYFGFGVDAHSYDGKRRWANVDTLTDYLQLLEQGRSPIKEAKNSEPSEQMEERFFLGLRRLQGISLTALAAEFGEPARQRCEERVGPFRDAGWVETDGDQLRLTD
ncbi:MAG TPA: radical SAM family heme chaperone HemW, partial [Terriglobia bacterium]